MGEAFQCYHPMALQKLPNYLKTHRKRAGLSQDEVAFLLGLKAGARVCRDERFTQIAGLRTAFAYEIVFNTPASELFAGIYQKVELEVSVRAKKLAEQMLNAGPGDTDERKLKFLRLIGSSAMTESPENE